MNKQKNTKSKKSPHETNSSPSLKTPLESSERPIFGDVSLLNKEAIEHAVSKGIAKESAIALIQQHYDNAPILLSLK